MKNWSCVLFLALTLLVASCGGDPQPIGTLDVSPTRIDLQYPRVADVEFQWQVSQRPAEMAGEPRVFVHLTDDDGQVVRTFDHSLAGTWREGETIEYSARLYQSALAPALRDGEYTLVAGLYDDSGERWPLATVAEEKGTSEYKVATVSASSKGVSTPQFFFPEAWLPVEGGTDRQVLGRRWLTQNSHFLVTGIPEGGSLWMLVGVPEPRVPEQEMLLDDGATAPSVRVASSCGGQPTTLSGAGSHVVELTIDVGDEAQAECEVSFEANFSMLSKASSEVRTIALEGLSWAG